MTQSTIPEYFPRIEIAGVDLSAIVQVQGQDYQIGDLSLYEDENDRCWVNHITVVANWQRRGIGRLLIQTAADNFGTIFFSTQTNQDYADDDNDTRHLSVEGAALGNSCVRHGLNVLFAHPRDFEEPSDFEDDY